MKAKSIIKILIIAIFIIKLISGKSLKTDDHSSQISLYAHKAQLNKLTKLSDTLPLIHKKLTFPTLEPYSYVDSKNNIKIIFSDFKNTVIIVKDKEFSLSNYENTLKLSSSIIILIDFSIVYNEEDSSKLYQDNINNKDNNDRVLKDKDPIIINNCNVSFESDKFDITQKYYHSDSAPTFSIEHDVSLTLFVEDSTAPGLSEKQNANFILGLKSLLSSPSNNIIGYLREQINSVVFKFYQDFNTLFKQEFVSIKEKGSKDVVINAEPVKDPSSIGDYVLFLINGKVNESEVINENFNSFNNDRGDLQIFVSNNVLSNLIKFKMNVFNYSGYISKSHDFSYLNLNYDIEELGQVIPEMYFQYARHKKYILQYSIVDVSLFNEEVRVKTNDVYKKSLSKKMNKPSNSNTNSNFASSSSFQDKEQPDYNMFVTYTLVANIYLANSERLLLKFETIFISELNIQITQNKDNPELSEFNINLGEAKYFSLYTDGHDSALNDFYLRDLVLNKFNDALVKNPISLLASNYISIMNCKGYYIYEKGILFTNKND